VETGLYTPKPNNTSEVKNVLQAIWADMPQSSIIAAMLMLSFRKASRLHACIKVFGGHFGHDISSLPNFTFTGTLEQEIIG